MIAFDTETHLFGPANMAPRPVCVTYLEDGMPGGALSTHVADAARWLLKEEQQLVGHNVSYDVASLMAHDPTTVLAWFEAYDEGRVHCTMVREKLLHIATGHHFIAKGRYSLGQTAVRNGVVKEEDLDPSEKIEFKKIQHLPQEEWPWRYRFSELDGLDINKWPKVAAKYAIQDAELTHGLYLAQEAKSKRINYELVDQERQARAALAFHLMDVWGVVTDPVAVAKLEESLQEQREEHAKVLRNAGLLDSKGKKSVKKLRDIVFQAFHAAGLPVPLAAGGSVKYDATTLEDIDDPLCESWRKYQKIDKYLTTYTPTLKAPIVHSRTNVLVDTGRSSQSNPNRQNLPRKGGVRECYVARPGHVLLACDYDSMEMRTWAQSCLDLVGHSLLAERYQDDPDFDPHTDFAATNLHDPRMSYEEALKIKKHGSMADARQAAKIGNFGLPGGMGPGGLKGFARSAYGVILTLKRATEIKAAWLAQWPEANDYFALISSLTEKGEIIQIRSDRVRGDAHYCANANSFFQGLAADAAKAAMWEVVKRCYTDPSSALWNSRPWNFVHDEGILETPEERMHDAAMEFQAVMVEEAQKWCPDVPIRAGVHAMRRWSKKAGPVFKDGRLIPWTPKA